ncbi:MAG: branched-chain amino acid ABC transporter permease [Deinococcales bacterium]
MADTQNAAKNALQHPAAAKIHSNRLRNALLSLVALVIGIFVLRYLGGLGSAKLTQALALFAIWGVATVSLNLINGTLGILSLGHHGFMLIGGYTTALLILSDDARNRIQTSARSQMTDFTLGLSVQNWLHTLGLDRLTTDDTLWVRFLIAILIGGLLAMLFGILVGFPSLRLRGDYLAVVTFGFGEIIRLLASTRIFAPFTNGALGFAGVPGEFGKSIWWTFGFLAITVFFMAKLKYSSYGRAMEAVREDQIAAEAMGINLAYHKVLGFALSAFFAGIAGGLWVSWLANARLDNFAFTLTFFFLVAISLGGTGSITGVLLGTAVVIFVRQYGDPLEESYTIATWLGLIGLLLVLAGIFILIFRNSQRLRPRFHPSIAVMGLGGIVALIIAYLGGAAFWPAFNLNIFQAPTASLAWPWLQDTFRGFGMRAIFLSVLLIVIMIFRPAGIMGRNEFNWAWVFRERRDQPSEEERRQDAWLSNPALNKAAQDPNDQDKGES